MRPSIEEMPDLQRLSLIGTVFYVHRGPKRAVQRPPLVAETPEVEAALLAAHPSDVGAGESTDTEESEPAAISEAPDSDADAEAPDSDADAEAPDSDADAEVPDSGADAEAPDSGADAEVPDSGADLDLPRPVPRGFAVEFGTGRLIPLQYTPDGFRMIPRRSRGHM